MAENTGNPNISRKLADEELAAVSGGGGFWHRDRERSLPELWRRDGHGMSYEEWLPFWLEGGYEDSMKARKLWLALPEEKRYKTMITCHDGEVIYSDLS